MWPMPHIRSRAPSAPSLAGQVRSWSTWRPVPHLAKSASGAPPEWTSGGTPTRPLRLAAQVEVGDPTALDRDLSDRRRRLVEDDVRTLDEFGEHRGDDLAVAVIAFPHAGVHLDRLLRE